MEGHGRSWKVIPPWNRCCTVSCLRRFCWMAGRVSFSTEWQSVSTSVLSESPGNKGDTCTESQISAAGVCYLRSSYLNRRSQLYFSRDCWWQSHIWGRVRRHSEGHWGKIHHLLDLWWSQQLGHLWVLRLSDLTHWDRVRSTQIYWRRGPFSHL